MKSKSDPTMGLVPESVRRRILTESGPDVIAGVKEKDRYDLKEGEALLVDYINTVTARFEKAKERGQGSSVILDQVLEAQAVLKAIKSRSFFDKLQYKSSSGKTDHETTAASWVEDQHSMLSSQEATMRRGLHSLQDEKGADSEEAKEMNEQYHRLMDLVDKLKSLQEAIQGTKEPL